MFELIAIIITVVSLLAYAGVAVLHERLADVRHAARTYIAPPFVLDMVASPTVEGEWDGRHPKDMRARRHGRYIAR